MPLVPAPSPGLSLAALPSPIPRSLLLPCCQNGPWVSLWSPVWVPAPLRTACCAWHLAGGCPLPSLPHLCSGNRIFRSSSCRKLRPISSKSLSASPLDIPVSIRWCGVRNSFETVLAAGLTTPPLPPVKLPRRAAGPWLTLGTRCIWDPSVMKSLEKASCLRVKRPQQLPSKLVQADYLLKHALQSPGTSLSLAARGLGLLWLLQVVCQSVCARGLKALLYTWYLPG